MGNLDTGHWITEPVPAGAFGFIYIITNITNGKKYIGKKQFVRVNKVAVKGRKNRKVVISESDWRTYTGSSVKLNEDILKLGKQNFTFEILSIHMTKGDLHYEEVRQLVLRDCLRERNNFGRTYYNGMIPAVKFIPK